MCARAVRAPFVLQDDNLVDFDKIGSGNYYWSFPSKHAVMVRHCAIK